MRPRPFTSCRAGARPGHPINGHAFRVARQGLSSRRSWLLANRRWTGGRPLSLVKLYYPMLLRNIRPRPNGFIEPCLPSAAPKPPAGDGWIHEIKHDGFRVIARKDGSRVRLYSRPGNDLTRRFPLIVDALARLRSRSCIIDGEAVACCDDGITSFDLLRHRRRDDQ